MERSEHPAGPSTEVRLNHPVHLPVYPKVQNYEHHPREGPAIAILSGGSGARALSETLIRFTHNSIHVLPVFDDGGSSRELRQRLAMPPPGDLRNRLMALSDMSCSGNPEVSRLFRTRLPAQGTARELQTALESFISDEHLQMAKIERRYRRIIINHLDRFNYMKPADFDLRGGNIGNFVMAGSYLSVGDLESVIFEFSALAAVRGQVFPACTGSSFHLRAELEDGDTWIGQSQLTSHAHPPLRLLSVVEKLPDGTYVDAHPEINPLAEAAIRKAAVITFAMGSFYTSIVSNLLVTPVGQVIRECKRPKVFVANLMSDHETPGMTVSGMLAELHRYLCLTDDRPGSLDEYINYALVGQHGPSGVGGRVPVDIEAIRALGVEPIVLPLELGAPEEAGHHDPEMVAAVLLSLS